MKWYYSKWVGGPKLLTLVQAQVWWLPKNEEIMVKLMASDGSAAQWTIGDWLHWTNAYNASTKWKPKCCECARKLAKCCGLCPNTLLLDATHAMRKTPLTSPKYWMKNKEQRLIYGNRKPIWQPRNKENWHEKSPLPTSTTKDMAQKRRKRPVSDLFDYCNKNLEEEGIHRKKSTPMIPTSFLHKKCVEENLWRDWDPLLEICKKIERQKREKIRRREKQKENWKRKGKKQRENLLWEQGRREKGRQKRERLDQQQCQVEKEENQQEHHQWKEAEAVGNNQD